MTKTNQTEMDLGVKFKAPTLEQVKREASIIGMEEIEAEKFWNYHGSGGWMVGRKKMKYWGLPGVAPSVRPSTQAMR